MVQSNRVDTYTNDTFASWLSVSGIGEQSELEIGRQTRDGVASQFIVQYVCDVLLSDRA